MVTVLIVAAAFVAGVLLADTVKAFVKTVLGL